jgi:hypothetical protein
MGDLGMTVWYVGNLLNGCVFGGEPIDTTLAEADELLALDLDENDRLHILSGYVVSGSMYGLDVRAMETELASAVDPQTRRGADFYRTFAHAARGEWLQASEAAERANKERPGLGMLPMSALTAALAGDVPRMRRLVELSRETSVSGRLGEMERSATGDLLLVADGRVTEALPGLRDALRLADEMSARLIYGMLALAMMKFLGPDSAEARAAGEKALAYFELGKNRAMAGHIRAALRDNGSAQVSDATEEAVRVGV